MLFLWTARVALAIGAGGSKPLLALCFFPAEGLKGGFLVFLVLDFLDPLLPTACTSSSKTPFLQLKECQLVIIITVKTAEVQLKLLNSL